MSAATVAPTRSLHRRPSAAAPVGPRRSSAWRRRAVAVGALLVVVFALTVAIGRVGAEAELADRVAGHVVVAPGETLWDVAAATAPAGVDVREQLAAIEALNGRRAHEVDAWTVVLLPAR
jgi:Tfp pilus assembly protein FimV